INANGPVSKTGTLKCKEEIEINGPLTNNGGEIECEELEINGPLVNTSDFSIKANEVEINGPLASSVSLKFPKDLKIAGPVGCEGNLEAQKIKIAGPIDIEGSLTASEKIKIRLGRRASDDRSLIHCDYIQAPYVEISSKGYDSPFIEVALKGKQIILRNVRHKGPVEGNLTLEDGATHED
ncbi:MAG: hypothetical protein ACFFBD_15675, partial [Candidatus Hodarchaeota archaeon]